MRHPKHVVDGFLDVCGVINIVHFNTKTAYFEYKRNPRYMYYNYVNKGTYEYDGQTLLLNWDVFPQQEFIKKNLKTYISITNSEVILTCSELIPTLPPPNYKELV